MQMQLSSNAHPLEMTYPQGSHLFKTESHSQSLCGVTRDEKWWFSPFPFNVYVTYLKPGWCCESCRQIFNRDYGVGEESAKQMDAQSSNSKPSP